MPGKDQVYTACGLGHVDAMRPRCVSLVSGFVLWAIARPQAQEPVMDSHSHGNPRQVRVTHVSLDLALDFERKTAAGLALLRIERTDRKAPLVLDCKGYTIDSVQGDDGSAREFKFGTEDKLLGAPVQIQLKGDDQAVRVRYRTKPEADALQWLLPEQTAGGKRPFLFTQGQAILTRSWIPLQDSPGVRVSYDACVRAPEGLTVVMSAQQLGKGADGSFRFKMDQPIPPYLIAMACGDLVFEPISPRCGVWAEPGLAKSAAKEFEDTEAMIATAEKLFGPYRWGRYDVLVLPPSFPFGGMENPRLTFATPTILAGDKSLVALVAHELAHSWSGNLVTNATWRDFWLNEGFTVFLEQRIMEAVFGKARSDMEKVLERKSLEDEMKELKPEAQVLHIDLRGKHPDDGFSAVPYTKGALFLQRCEQLFGREAFDKFLGSWFSTHAFQSLTTAQFLAFLEKELLAAHPEQKKALDLDAWMNQPGLPADAPRTESAALQQVDAALQELVGGKEGAALATKGWVTQQWLRFLDGLPQDLGAERMAKLDSAFRFTQSGNSEILCAWLKLAIRHRYAAADQKLERFLMDVGRRKFLKPLYTELMKTPEGAARARALYQKARPRYHSVSSGTLDKIVNG
jgi:leukotriene-A4 hydrolase